MGHQAYLSSPIKTDRMPPGIPYIVGNEAAERFTFYGLRAILVVFMTKFLLNAQGQPAPMSDAEATEAMHIFLFGVYFFPFIGAILSDAFLGKYKTILSLSMVYCLGPLVLAFSHTRLGLFSGLWLIVIGSGGIKPCVSAHVGDQFGAGNQHLLARAFSWFYFSVNVGSTLSMAITPVLLEKKGPAWAFGVPAVLMVLATFLFWIGRHKFIHIPPAGSQFVRETFSIQGLKSISKILSIFAFIPFFWALFDQTASRWVLQGQKMQTFNIFGHSVLPEQMQTLNPILVLILIPVFTYVIYPWAAKIFPLTPLRRIGLGFFVVTTSFLVPAWIQMRLDAGAHPSLLWQVPAYILLTCAEILISITALEFAYTQSPKTMKSLIMSVYLLTVAFGNLITALVNKALEIDSVSQMLQGPRYFLFFAALPFVAGLIFIFVARRYKEENILQDSPGSAVTSPDAPVLE
ncbi:MAG: POT family MFS transporter [Verrucomicrobiota bacterium]